MSDEAEFMLRLIDGVSGPAGKAGGSLKDLLKNLGATGKGAEHAGGMMHQAWAVTIGTAIERAGEKVLEFGAHAAVAVFEAVDHVQRASVAFDMLAKHGASGAKIFDFTRKMAQDLGLDVNDTVHQMEHFLAMQFNPAQAEALIKMGTDMQAVGASAESVKSIWLNMGQIMAQGKLNGSDLRQLEQAGISGVLVMDALAKHTGMAASAIPKAISAGAIKADVALNAIGDAILHKTQEHKFGEAGARMANETIGGLWGQLRAGMQNVMLDLGKLVGPSITGAFRAIGDAVTGALGGGTGGAFMGAVAGGISGIADAVKAAAPMVGAFVKAFGGAAVETFNVFSGILKSVMGAFSGGTGTGVEMAKMLGQALGQLAVGMLAAGAVIGGVFAALVVGGAVVWGGLKAVFSGLVDTIGSIVFPIVDMFANISAIFDASGKTLFEKIFLIGGQIMQGLTDGLLALAMSPITAIESVGADMLTRIKGVLGIHSPSTEFEWIGQMTSAGFQKGVNDNGGLDMSVPSVAGRGAGGSLAGSLGGGASVTVQQTFHIDGSQNPADTAREVARVSLTSLQSALEQLAMEAA